MMASFALSIGNPIATSDATLSVHINAGAAVDGGGATCDSGPRERVDIAGRGTVWGRCDLKDPGSRP